MKKSVVMLVTAMILAGCFGGTTRHTAKGGTNMKDGDPERAIRQHNQHVVRNEAAAAAAVGSAAKQLGIK